jgi:hypothetical protein
LSTTKTPLNRLLPILSIYSNALRKRLRSRLRLRRKKKRRG